MVHDKVRHTSNKSPSRSTSQRSHYRRTSRVNPTCKDNTPNNFNQQLWSTSYTLTFAQQTQHADKINISHTTPGSSSCLHNICESDEASRENTFVRSQSEKSSQDKVEDMDIDHNSDHEENYFSPELPGTSTEVVLQTNLQDTKGKVYETKKDKKMKEMLKESKQDKKEKMQSSSKTKKNPSHEVASGSKVVKKKPIYIILHAALVRVAGITGKATTPVRLQAEKILIQMEIKSGSSCELLSLRIPWKELVAVQANLSEPPHLLVVSVNHDYSQNLVNGSKKNGVLSKIGVDELEIVIQLTYDSIPKDVEQDLDMLRKHLSNDVRWKEISSVQAERILSNKMSEDSTDAVNKEEKLPPSAKERKTLKAKRNRKKGGCDENEDAANKGTTKPTVLITSEEGDNCAEPDLQEEVNSANSENSATSNDDSPDKIVDLRRKRACSDTADLPTEEREEKLEKEPDETLERNTQHSNGVASEREPNDSSRNEIVDDKRSQEQSFEENRVIARRFTQLEAIIVDKEGLLNQRRIRLELRELQLEQERNSVQELRGSLREEQRTRRELETRYEAINGEIVARNSQDMLMASRIQEMERELCQLNLSLGNVRTENQHLVSEINEFRRCVAESERAVTSERNTIATLQQDLEEKRTTLERLREEVRQKDEELKREQDSRAEAEERKNDMERSVVATREQYEERLRRSNEECTRLGQQYEECSRTLAAARDQVQDVNCTLSRAQETIDEYSRMQPRDWTIERDEIEISEIVLGQGGWGWVKEGLFRGTKVAVKQMHELIVSPHNRRLFEREMRMAATCRHPSLLQFIGATNDDDIALLVTELLDTSLRTVLGQRSLCHEEVLTLSLDVSRALNYLHLNKPFPIIHRDISSTNVLLWRRDDAWHAKLSDYGAANFMRQCMTVNPGASIYAAPEVMTSRQSTKVDVYSFGLLLCEMCIRELPVPQHQNDQIRSITNGHLRDLVQRCAHEAPEDRPTIHDVLSTLQHLCPSVILGMVSVNSRQVVL